MSFEIPVLSPGRDVCTIGDQTLRVNQSVDYQSATERVTSVGKILSFMYAGHRQADTQSVWMLIADMGRESTTEWVSVLVWKRHHDNGRFRKPGSQPAAMPAPAPAPQPQPTTVNDTHDTRDESLLDDDLPF